MTGKVTGKGCSLVARDRKFYGGCGTVSTPVLPVVDGWSKPHEARCCVDGDLGTLTPFFRMVAAQSRVGANKRHAYRYGSDPSSPIPSPDWQGSRQGGDLAAAIGRLRHE